VATIVGGLKMSESIEYTIFYLIKYKDEKRIKDLLDRGLATEEMVEEQRKSYQRIYGEDEKK
jgi:hypothetical protein